MPRVKMVCGDTMNYWIAAIIAKKLRVVLAELDVLLINDGEARMLSGVHNLVQRGGSDAWRWGRRRW